MTIDRPRIADQLRAFDLPRLFIEELGCDRPASRHPERVEIAVHCFDLTPVAEKRGFRVFHCTSIPDRNTRQKIEREITKRVFEHLIIFTDAEKTKQIWQWVAREKGKPDAFREHLWLANSDPEPLIQKLAHIAFSLDEEESLTLSGVTHRMRDAFDRERITKRFYEAFKQQHDRFLGFIEGLASATDRQWYASLMLNRLMFVYFIQKKGFLDGDINYLNSRLASVRATKGADQFHSFYRAFLLKLFHGGLATPATARETDTARLIGNIPYLNGGLFEPHALEAEGNSIQITDAAFEGVFAFFDQYEWTLDTRAIERADGREINPDVLGHIFEKYINQKQMGAYYTKEDITDYITKNTVIPWLFQNAIAHDKVAFEPGSAVWRMLSENPDVYIYPAVKHGADQPLPDNIAAGVADVALRGDWNKTAPASHGLPTETWRELIARRERYAGIKAKARAGEISSIEDFVTLNLDIRQFARDAIQYAEGPDLVRAFWKGISAIKVLDPACGSGAFLFAALNILYDLYDACLERMEVFVETAPERSGPHQLYSDFRAVLDRIERHPNRPYFIYKSIILDNLYGVDIMDEAVEICKLRLFLKLASQLERADQIEPLPDIDFNIRAGNSLIGYTSIADVRKTTEAKGFDFDERAGKIEAAAQDLDAAFRLFREQQTALHGAVGADHKAQLRERLAELEAQLDRFLANDYGVEIGDDLTAKAKFATWKASHKPFHWLIEFYGIIANGGFDVAVGNPPYREYAKVKAEDGYSLTGYKTIECGNLYAFFIEKCYNICANYSFNGMILPIASISTDRMSQLQDIYNRDSDVVWVSSFSWRPARLFDGASTINSIILARKMQSDARAVFSTGYRKWNSLEREFLFRTIRYTECSDFIISGSIPKIESRTSKHILNKINVKSRSLHYYFRRSGSSPIYYYRGMLYWIKVLDFIPKLLKDGKPEVSGQCKTVYVDEEIITPSAMQALLSSSTFFFYYQVFSDCQQINAREFASFKVEFDKRFVKNLDDLGRRLSEDQKRNSVIRKRVYKSGSVLDKEYFYISKSKGIIDEIDAEIARHYGFSAEELDFCRNYDIKYRMGADEDDTE